MNMNIKAFLPKVLALAALFAGLALPPVTHAASREVPPDALRCLALAVYFEAGSEPHSGKEAVAHVVLNRAQHAGFPGGVCDVVQQGGEGGRCQFGWYCDGRSDQPTSDRMWRSAQDVAREVGDFVLQRADGLTAYQLATVVDDAFQGVTQVVRGADLLSSTPRQIVLQRCLGLPTPTYAHLPLLVDTTGAKLGKQTAAPALEAARASDNLTCVLTALSLAPPRDLHGATPARLLEWAQSEWNFERLAGQRAVTLTPA